MSIDATNVSTTSTVALAPPDVILQELGDEVVVANLDTGVYFSMNEVAARIWSLLLESSSIGEVVAKMLDEYDVDEAAVRADVNRLIDELLEHGLIRLRDA
jgi:hypothetical protein